MIEKKLAIIDGSLTLSQLPDNNVFKLRNSLVSSNSIYMFYKKLTKEYIYFTFDKIDAEYKTRLANKKKATVKTIKPTTFIEEE